MARNRSIPTEVLLATSVRRWITTTCLSGLISVLALHGIAMGQTNATTVSSGGAKAVKSSEKVYIAFRMEKWYAKHMHDAAQAKQHAETLKKLGCEVKTNQHNGHTDVHCRTVLWKSMVLDSNDQANQWTDWLKQAGFDILQGVPAGTERAPRADGKPLEVVQYRRTEWQAQHIHNSTELNQLLTLYRALGIEVELVDHSGHKDVRSRCTEWMEIELPNHQAAHGWQEFLNQSGFETKHEH